LHLQTTMALVNSPIATQTQLPPTDGGHESPTHPALEGLANLSNIPLQEILTKQRMGSLATEYGMRDVIRWQPKNVGIPFLTSRLQLTLSR
jgi:large subunit ribosomal protein L15